MTTNNTRTIKELLTVMLENIHFESGLCWWICNLYWKGIISSKEYHILKDYVLSNKPITFYRMFGKLDYYWRVGNINPRIRWIKKHIKKNS